MLVCSHMPRCRKKKLVKKGADMRVPKNWMGLDTERGIDARQIRKWWGGAMTLLRSSGMKCDRGGCRVLPP